jgi:uncharacterized protein
MADHYAAALARRGFTAITFDVAGWGQSGGDLRQYELPSRKVADIAAAAAFVATLSFVEPGGVGYLGVCASAQDALAAVAQGMPIASFASWFHDTPRVSPFYGGTPGMQARLDHAEAALDRYRRTGEVITVPAYQAGDNQPGMFLEMDYFANPARGAVPKWRNEMRRAAGCRG